MAPNLRSTPARANAAQLQTPTSTPRKIPHCTTCKRPRAGHPRAGCPYGPTNTQVEEDFGNMTISSRDRKDGDVLSSGSLDSLSTTSSAVLTELARPGFLDSPLDELPQLKFPTTPKTEDKKFSRIMPGTFTPLTLSQASFQQTQDEEEEGESNLLHRSESTETLHPDAEEDAETSESHEPSPSPTPTKSRKPVPLTRTHTSPSQRAFLASLTQSALYICPAPADIAYEAQKVGLFFLLVDQAENSAVIGRDEEAVKALVEKHRKEKAKAGRKSGGAFKAVAGGAAMGAAATFASLAFS